MSENYNVLARKTGIHFSVRSELDRQRQPSDSPTPQEMDIDIERGGCNDIKEEDDSTALCVSIDELKIG